MSESSNPSSVPGAKKPEGDVTEPLGGATSGEKDYVAVNGGGISGEKHTPLPSEESGRGATSDPTAERYPPEEQAD